MGSDLKQGLVGRWSWAGEGMVASYWAQMPLGLSLCGTQYWETQCCVTPRAMTYMLYMRRLYVRKRAPIINAVMHCCCLQRYTLHVTAKVSLKKYTEVSTRWAPGKKKTLLAFRKSVKKLITENHEDEMLVRNLFNEHSLPKGHEGRMTKESLFRKSIFMN